MVKNYDRIVPDTSVIVDQVLSQKIKSKEIIISELIIPEAVLAEVEHMANQNKTIGYLGLEELNLLQNLSKTNNFQISYSGRRPSKIDIDNAKLGDIDSIIRSVAFESDATLFTADDVLSKVSKAKGISTIKVTPKFRNEDNLKDFFTEDTMSVHLRENQPPFAKVGKPGEWQFKKINDVILTREKITSLSNEIVETAESQKDCFLEIDRPGSTIVQIRNYRIVITKPPFSDGWEITAVRPVTKLSLEEYNLPDKIMKRISTQAEGILIAGAPGNGKSTFAQALSEHYATQDKVVKTVEAPRDLQLPDSITQYAISHGSPQEIHDILLLTRPDYTIFDEMRNTEDFRLFADMRLSGVGIVGIVHATNAIDSIQRFIGRIELGTIPQIIDTVIFIKEGEPKKVFSIKMQVKVPSGMKEADLARPIVCVYDYLTEELEFELYSYGEETVVIPVEESSQQKGTGKDNKPKGAQALAKKIIGKELQKYTTHSEIVFDSNERITIKVPEDTIPNIIGRQGKNVEKLQEKLGVHIDVEKIDASTVKELQKPAGKPLKFEFNIRRKYVELILSQKFSNKEVDVYIDDDFLVQVHVGKTGIIKVKKENPIGQSMMHGLEEQALFLYK